MSTANPQNSSGASTGNIPPPLGGGQAPPPPTGSTVSVASASTVTSIEIFPATSFKGRKNQIPALVGLGVLITILAFLLAARWGASSFTDTALWNIFLNTTPEAKFILLFVVAPFFLFTLFNVVREWRRLGKEINAVEMLQQDISTQVGNNRIHDLSKIKAMLPECDPYGALHRSIEAIWNNRNLSNPDIEALLSAASQVESTRANSGRTAPNRILLLSLLGTIIGLAGVIASLEPQVQQAIDSNNAQKLLTGLSVTLKTMGTAFASTAWGVLFSGIVAWANSALASQRAFYIAMVEHLVVAELSPRILPQNDAVEIERLQLLIDTSNTQLQTRLQSVETFLNNSNQQLTTQIGLVDTTVKNGQALLHNTEVVCKDLLQNQHDALYVVATSIHDTTKTLMATASGFDQAIRNAETFVADSARELTDAVNKVKQTYTNLDSSVDKLAKALEARDQKLDGIVQGQQKFVKDQESALQNFRDEIVKLTDSVSDHTRAVLGGLNTATQANTDLNRSASQQLTSEINRVIESVNGLLARISPNLPGNKEWSDIQKTLSQAAAATERFSQAMQQGGSGRSGDSTAALSELKRLLEPLSQLPGRFDEFSRQMSAAVSQVAASSSASSGRGTAAPDQDPAQMRQLEQVLRDHSQQTTQVERQIASALGTLNTSLVQLSQQVYALHQAITPPQTQTIMPPSYPVSSPAPPQPSSPTEMSQETSPLKTLTNKLNPFKKRRGKTDDSENRES